MCHVPDVVGMLGQNPIFFWMGRESLGWGEGMGWCQGLSLAVSSHPTAAEASWFWMWQCEFAEFS